MVHNSPWNARPYALGIGTLNHQGFLMFLMLTPKTIGSRGLSFGCKKILRVLQCNSAARAGVQEILEPEPHFVDAACLSLEITLGVLQKIYIHVYIYIYMDYCAYNCIHILLYGYNHPINLAFGLRSFMFQDSTRPASGTTLWSTCGSRALLQLPRSSKRSRRQVLGAVVSWNQRKIIRKQMASTNFEKKDCDQMMSFEKRCVVVWKKRLSERPEMCPLASMPSTPRESSKKIIGISMLRVSL